MRAKIGRKNKKKQKETKAREKESANQMKMEVRKDIKAQKSHF